MNTSLQQTLLFIVQFVFGFYAYMISIRLWVRCVKSESYHPFLIGIAKLSDGFIRRLRPYAADIGNIETASLILLFVVILLKLVLMSLIVGHTPALLGLLAWTLISVIEVCLDTIFYVMIMMAILSWMPQVQPALHDLLSEMTRPLLRPIQNIIPLLGGMDLSPIVIVLGIQVLEILIVHPVARASLMATLQ